MPTAGLTTNLGLVSTCALALALGACSRGLDVTVNPYEIALPPGGTQAFRGWVSAESPLTSTALSWAADRGSIAGTGETVTYTAPIVLGPDAVTATSRSNAGRSATATVTVTTSGARVWARQFGAGEFEFDEAHAIATDTAANVLVVGSTFGSLAGDNASGRDALVRMYDLDGQALWTRQFGTSDDDVALGVALDPTGNVLVVGEIHGSPAGGADAFVRMYDAGGAEGWARQFGTLDHDIATGVAVDPSGRVLVVGNTFWGGSGQSRIEPSGFVRCFDAAGNELWERKFGIHHANDDPAIAVDGSGNVLIARTAGAEGPSDSVVMKLDANGDELWSRRVGTTTNDQATTLAVDAAENVFVAGTTTYWLDTLWGGFRTDAFVWRFTP